VPASVSFGTNCEYRVDQSRHGRCQDRFAARRRRCVPSPGRGRQGRRCGL